MPQTRKERHELAVKIMGLLDGVNSLDAKYTLELALELILDECTSKFYEKKMKQKINELFG
jgi:hypothetical protein